mgnify:CR=1 FL=1
MAIHKLSDEGKIEQTSLRTRQGECLGFIQRVRAVATCNKTILIVLLKFNFHATNLLLQENI